MDPDQVASSEASWSGSVVFWKKELSGFSRTRVNRALDKLLGQLGTYATWLSSIAYLQKQLRIFIFFYATFFFL